MNNTQLKADIDRLDTGLPDFPDLGPVLGSGRRMRRRRRAGVTLGLGALAAAAVVPLGLQLGGHTESPVAGADGGTPDPTVPSQATSTWVGPEFGTSMEATVLAALPGAARTGELVGDHFVTAGRRDGSDLLQAASSTPVDWPHVVVWTQNYAMPGVAELDVSAERLDPEQHSRAMRWCSAKTYVAETSCDVSRIGDRTVVVHRGVRSEGMAPGRWGVEVEVVGDDAQRGMDSGVSVWAVAEGATWTDARSSLPAVDDLTDLALDPALVLPEPESYPG